MKLTKVKLFIANQLSEKPFCYKSVQAKIKQQLSIKTSLLKIREHLLFLKKLGIAERREGKWYAIKIFASELDFYDESKAKAYLLKKGYNLNEFPQNKICLCALMAYVSSFKKPSFENGGVIYERNEIILPKKQDFLLKANGLGKF